MIHLIGNLYSVEVPSDATEFTINFKNHTYGNLKILGEVRKDSLSFNTEPYVQKENLINPNESFRSLLQSKGIYFENPIEKPNYKDYNSKKEYDKQFEESYKKWQESENKVIKGKLIILEKL